MTIPCDETANAIRITELARGWWMWLVVLLLCLSSPAEARPVQWGGLFLGVQQVALVSAPKTDGLALTGLALFVLPKHQTLQAQIIAPIFGHDSEVLYRIAWDIRVW